MKGIKLRKKIILLGIIILILLSMFIAHFIKMKIGYYFALKIQGIDKKSEIEKIYNSKDDFLLITTEKRIYLAKLCNKSNRFKIYKEITSKIDKFNDINGSFQLKNGIIVFYNINNEQNDLIEFKFFNLNDNKIIKETKNTIETNFNDSQFLNFCDIENGDFIISYRVQKNKQAIERYISKNNTFEKITTDAPYQIGHSSAIKLKEDIFLIIKKNGNYKKQENSGYLINAYLFNNKTNKIHSRPIKFKKILGDSIDFQVIPLNSSFLVFQRLYPSMKNVVTLFKIDDLNIEQLKTTELEFPYYSIVNFDIIQLNKDEILISGGMKGSLMGYGGSKDSYIYNIQSNEITKTFKMKENRTSWGTIVINEKKAIRYGKSLKIDLFRKGV